ncbi:SGNH/GDSL hydrolase family protein [Tenggerimyces flavus]|uniref:SGNH/GDSL hydrolase family protein n=1 Tax=Tenggerimyces flavus TaxID=1708749 RepID=A0ABV7YE37_9ACTN|nr:hypothetical protein [Tenggerimyces flavus]MBM7784320.1 hypothetical protein [Tenggerimyces flavus]
MRILFVGNSFTARNNLPALLARLAKERGIAIEHKLVQAGGASLRQHLNSGAVAAALEADAYDVVVLQEQSTLPGKNAKRMHENVREMHDLITAAGAKTALYMTWAWLNRPDGQAAITTAYASIAAELGATLVPVGMVWERFLREHDQPVLHDDDGSHPALAGTYLAACVFLIALLQEDPVGLEAKPKALSNEDAALIRCETWRLCEDLAAGR